MLSRAELTVDGREPESVSGGLRGPNAAEFVAVLRGLGDPGPDPTVWLRRRRTACGTGCVEELRLDNASGVTLTVQIRLDTAADLAPIEVVKLGGTAGPRTPAVTADGLRWQAAAVTVTLSAPGAECADDGTVTWQLTVPARGQAVVSWQLIGLRRRCGRDSRTRCTVVRGTDHHRRRPQTWPAGRPVDRRPHRPADGDT